jgi:glycosyltransferase involved in cell wall biosynthesis
MTLRVIVPAYNCADWIVRCLDSIRIQTYKDFTVQVVDDASTDSRQVEFIRRMTEPDGWSYVANSVNKGAAWNIYYEMQRAAKNGDDPVLLIDGDDFLPHAGVFERVAEIYEDPDVWMMWTQYEPYPYHTTLDPSGQPVQVDPATTNRTQIRSGTYTRDEALTPGFFRNNPIRINHLVTFRTFLFKFAITPEQLTLADGTWPKAGYDRMIFTPLLEAAGADHIKFVDEVMYYYNSVNPNSDVSVRRADGDAAHARVSQLPVLEPLSSALVQQERWFNARLP